MDEDDSLVFLHRPTFIVEEKNNARRSEYYNNKIVIFKGLLVPMVKGLKSRVFKGIRVWKFRDSVVFRNQ